VGKGGERGLVGEWDEGGGRWESGAKGGGGRGGEEELVGVGLGGMVW